MWKTIVLACALVAGPASRIPAADETDALRTLLSDLDAVQLGSSEADLLQRFAPVKQDDGQRPTDRGHTVYTLKGLDGLFSCLIFHVNDARLTSVTAWSKVPLSDDWQGAERVEHWGKQGVECMEALWGAPRVKGLTQERRGRQEASLQWAQSNRVITATFTTPKSLMTFGRMDENPDGNFVLSITLPGEDTILLRKAVLPFDRAVLEADYHSFESMMYVESAPETQRLFPDAFRSLYLGMGTDELKATRPGARARDDFLSYSRDEITERLQEGRFEVADFRARRDQLVSAVFRVALRGGSPGTVRKELAAWCNRAWGKPQQCRTWVHAAWKDQPTSGRAYIWRHDDAQSVLVVQDPYDLPTRLVILEPKLPLDIPIPGLKPVGETTTNEPGDPTGWEELLR